MGEDISSGAKIGIILIILCSLIAIVFALLTMMKNITNTGTQQMQNGLDQMLSSQFQDYDQKTVTGTQVMSAMSIFDGQPVAFVVMTKESMKSGGSGAYCYGAVVQGAGAERDYVSSRAGKCRTIATDKVKRANATDNFYTMDLSVKDNGAYDMNMNTRPCKTQGTEAYIRSSAKFLAELIHDTTGDTVGIVFVQQ